MNPNKRIDRPSPRFIHADRYACGTITLLVILSCTLVAVVARQAARAGPGLSGMREDLVASWHQLPSIFLAILPAIGAAFVFWRGHQQPGGLLGDPLAAAPREATYRRAVALGAGSGLAWLSMMGWLAFLDQGYSWTWEGLSVSIALAVALGTTIAAGALWHDLVASRYRDWLFARLGLRRGQETRAPPDHPTADSHHGPAA